MLRTLLVLAIVAAGIVASLWSRFAALLTYVWFAIFRPQEWVWLDISWLRLSLVLGAMLVVPSLLTGVLPNLTHPLSLGTLAFLLSGVVAHFGAFNADISWLWLDTQARLTLVVLLAVTLLDTRRRIVLFLATLAGSFGVHTAKAGVAFLLGGGVYFAEGLGGAFTDNNGYALGAAVTLPLLYTVYQNRDRQSLLERWIGLGYLAAVPLTVLMIVGTMSRGGLVAIVAGVLAFLALQRRRVVPLLVLGLVLTVALPFVPTPEGWSARMDTITRYEEVGDASALSRLHFWEVARAMAAERPFGVGLRNYEYAYDRFDFSNGEYGRARSVHSSHFQVLAEQGYPGALIWVSVFAYAFVAAFRARRFGLREARLPAGEAAFFVDTANALIVSMTVFLAGGAFVAVSLNDLTWYTFAVVAAIDRLAAARLRELDAPAPPEVAAEQRWRATA